MRRQATRPSHHQLGSDLTRPGAAPLVPPQRRWRGTHALRIAERVFLVGGLVLFVFLIRELGARTVFDNLRVVGWGILLIIGQEALAYLANTLGWWAAFPSPRPAIPFRQLLAARTAGDAVNYVTPTATLGGEFVRTRFLHGHATGTALVASVTVAKLCQTIAQIVFVVIGLTVIVDETPLPSGIRHGLMAGLSAFSALVLVLILAQRRGMFTPLLRLAQWLRLSTRAPELTQQLQHLDEEIARIHGNAPGAVFLSVMGFLTGWACGVVEIYLILLFLGVPVSVQRALTIEILSVAIDGMLFFVPAKVGTQEGGKVLIFTILGLDPAKGLALGILRRIRELTWALIGLLILSRQQLAVRPVLEPFAR